MGTNSKNDKFKEDIISFLREKGVLGEDQSKLTIVFDNKPRHVELVELTEEFVKSKLPQVISDHSEYISEQIDFHEKNGSVAEWDDEEWMNKNIGNNE